MYTNLKNVQALIAALKAYSIKHVVVSPGNSHNAIVRSLEEDSYFVTYSVTDERSAAFFACGIYQELQEAIAICCTAGTAASNYLSGVTEAYRRYIPLVVITGDKNQYYLGQYEDQMIDTPSIFEKVTKKGCVLPMINGEKDLWYCNRVLNETLLELNHHGKGPVHIDVPIEDGMLAVGNSFTTKELPVFNRIKRYILAETPDLLSAFSKLYNKKVFVICGQDDHICEEEIELIENISEKYNCVFGTDKISNLHCNGTLEITRAVKVLGDNTDALFPDVIIYIAGNASMDYKFRLKSKHFGTELWIVNESGKIADPFKKLTTVFEGTTLQFLKEMDRYGKKGASKEYYDKWKEIGEKATIPDFEYSNLYAVKNLMNNIPMNSNLHLANSTTIRIAQFFDIDSSVQIYCNRGVNGIDGCVSSFIGQAAVSPNKMNYLIVGDLTFFYDMNAIWNRYVGNNVRIMLNNNEGAALFHFNQGGDYPNLNLNVAAEHFATAKGWVEAQGFKYLCAHNKEEYHLMLEEFLSKECDRPLFFEVFTHKERDAEIQRNFYNQISGTSSSSVAKQGVKKLLKSVLGEETIRKIKRNE